MRARLPMLPVAGERPLAPRISRFTRTFWDRLADGELVTTWCPQCRRFTFPPKPICPRCWSDSVEWRGLSGAGRLYSFTRVHVAPRAFRAEAPYAVGIVDLQDGVRLMCRLMGEVAAADIGAEVEMLVLQHSDGPLFAARRV